MTPEQKYYAAVMRRAVGTVQDTSEDEALWTAYQNVIAAKYKDPVDVLARQMFERVTGEGPYEHVAAYWREIAAAAIALLGSK